ncbi:hypothetical protein EVAR_29030_1 [Eumeta japonica]|uniref:Uncharacterized protein n=1 Tax=Eumeta variegata TaxID=151549 RepID=A0A4C1W415_EUMVA|nr:hypothetical protein EVAR_29030_1 [Eumeta japonica]
MYATPVSRRGQPATSRGPTDLTNSLFNLIHAQTSCTKTSPQNAPYVAFLANRLFGWRMRFRDELSYIPSHSTIIYRLLVAERSFSHMACTLSFQNNLLKAHRLTF